MIVFFKTKSDKIIAVQFNDELSENDVPKLNWLLDGEKLTDAELSGFFIGPRAAMVSPWSTNAVEITQNMAIENIVRIEEYQIAQSEEAFFDPMLENMFTVLKQDLFDVNIEPEKVAYIDDIAEYNKTEGLALSEDEVVYLENVSVRINRKLTDSEVFGFSQVNSEHCRHKIFNGTFIIDGKEKPASLFNLIRKTSKENPNTIVSAYKDNVSFVKGPKAMQFAPKTQNKADFFETKEIDTVLSLKAETHNFPTTVEPFNGAATGAGGEIRDRMAGGQGSVPMAGTAVYMTAYSRLEGSRDWEKGMAERDWLYQTPMDILIKASNGASDFGNKFGQPLINGSVLTFEHTENGKKFGFDKVIMQAGGIGYGKYEDALRRVPKKGDKIVVLGGDNYRIGMGGSSVSSVATGEFDSNIELNAIQRSNPEMQKRASNAVRAFVESTNNPIISIHDHGAGGHLNCLSELVEEVGGTINLRSLPIGDPTLSAKEIVGNESQERMGLVIKGEDVALLQEICERERAPMYVVGEITMDHNFKFEDSETGENPIDLQIEDMFGSPPKTVITDNTLNTKFEAVDYDSNQIKNYLKQVLQLEAVACKDWLTNKVDRSVTGKIAKQQTTGEIQLPLNNLGVVAIDYQGKSGIATALGHAPINALINPKSGSKMAIAESLTNIVWAPFKEGLKSISLSANWMWPCKNEGEDARLYEAVEAISDFACNLGINIPTGKDSLSMVQKYKDDAVYAPGTVIISASGEVSDIKKVVEPTLVNDENTSLVLVDFSKCSFDLGGSSFAQVLNKLGDSTPTICDDDYFARAFNTVQKLINDGAILAGHDISAGGLITTLLEMNFPNQKGGLNINFSSLEEKDVTKILFSEIAAVIIQVKDSDKVVSEFGKSGIHAHIIGTPTSSRTINIKHHGAELNFDIDEMRDVWYKTSYLLDKQQSTEKLATERFETYKNIILDYKFPTSFTGKLSDYGVEHGRQNKTGIKAAIIREKGVNGDREMAYSLFLAGFDVKDIHMTDLIAGREDLSDVNMIVYVGGFSNSDVLGSAKGWAGAFLYNPKAKLALDNFYARPDTLSLGVCNGCQLMMELGLIESKGETQPMHHNTSGKFESGYLNVDIPENNSIMLSSLAGSKLGIWVAHGEGRFLFEGSEEEYNTSLKYSNSNYPANPNGSEYNTAGICSNDGRHLGMMPHLERIIFPWQAAHYAVDRRKDEVTPWFEAFFNAKNWVDDNVKK
ncbi:MAG: phosphoribosylformylglycinamidine synthase [Flavobacteriales bacterium]|nr:phosphoribosylformylglycinamidine synthase [Flavobacteriales bacterium]